MLDSKNDAIRTLEFELAKVTKVSYYHIAHRSLVRVRVRVSALCSKTVFAARGFSLATTPFERTRQNWWSTEFQ